MPARKATKGPVSRALESALKTVPTTPADAAAVALARRMAAEVDEGPTSVDKAGSVLIRVLTELGMTPKARAAVVKGEAADDGSSKRQRTLDELRARRERRRAHNTATVD